MWMNALFNEEIYINFQGQVFLTWNAFGRIDNIIENSAVLRLNKAIKTACAAWKRKSEMHEKVFLKGILFT